MSNLSNRLIRYAELMPCRNAFIDTRSPGSEAKENFTLIGPGVSENPNQHVHIPEPHGFNIGGARQPGGCLNSQHSHETAEVFIVHTGKWRFKWGPTGDDGYIDLKRGDVISLPTQMFRGFENTGSRKSADFLFAILGGDDPGKVTWSPPVFDLAAKYGLVLLEGGRLIDTVAGEAIPKGARRQKPPSDAVMRKLASPSAEKMAQCVASFAGLRPNATSPLAARGVSECAIIGPVASQDGFAPGPITGWWHHGFSLRLLRLTSGAKTAAHVRHEAEVVFVQSGTLEIATPDGAIMLGSGDTFSTPIGLARSFRATASDGCVAYLVRGAESPKAPTFV